MNQYGVDAMRYRCIVYDQSELIAKVNATAIVSSGYLSSINIRMR